MDKSQLDKFKAAARELETDDDPKRFEERLAKLVKNKPVEKSDMKKWIATCKTLEGPVTFVIEADNLAVAYLEVARAGHETDQCEIEEAPAD
jgi:hypothetical protein